MLDNLQHILFDFGLTFRWFFEILKVLFTGMFAPVSFFYNFAISFFNNMSITYAEPITFIDQVSTVLTAIPLWSVLSVVVGAGFMFIAGIKIFHLITE